LEFSQETCFEKIIEAVLTYNYDEIKKRVMEGLATGVDPVTIIEKGLTRGLNIVGEKFQKGEMFLTDLISAAEPVQTIVKEVVEPQILKSKQVRKSLGKIVLGTVEGDIHDIGKTIVGAMLFSAGFEVHDIGKDVPVTEFIKKVKEVKADIVGASALLSTSLPAQRKLIEALVTEGMRTNVKVMVGGAPVTNEWAQEIGADGYGADAVEAVIVAKQLLGVSK